MLPTSISLASMLPAWGFFERMGHDRVPAWIVPVEGLTVCLITPALPAREDEHWTWSATDETRQLAQLGGPAFYGLRLVPEAEVRGYLEARQPRQLRTAPAVPLLEGPVVMAEEHAAEESAELSDDLVDRVWAVHGRAHALGLELSALTHEVVVASAVHQDLETAAEAAEQICTALTDAYEMMGGDLTLLAGAGDLDSDPWEDERALDELEANGDAHGYRPSQGGE